MELTTEEVQHVISRKFPLNKFILKIKQIKEDKIKVDIHEKECSKPILSFEIMYISKNLYIYIFEINKCNINGNTIINHIKFIGKELGCLHLQLEDESTIYQIDNTKFTLSLHDILGENCTIPLAIYKILLDGESWYNKYGFTNDEVEIEKPKWDLLRKESFINVYLRYKNKNTEAIFISQKINHGDDISFIQKTINKYELLQKKMLLFLGGNEISPCLSVKKVFELIEKKRKSLNDIEEAKHFYCELRNIIQIFEHQIIYQTFLHYIIPY
jgi:hypothetical protein